MLVHKHYARYDITYALDSIESGFNSGSSVYLSYLPAAMVVAPGICSCASMVSDDNGAPLIHHRRLVTVVPNNIPITPVVPLPPLPPVVGVGFTHCSSTH